MTVSSWSPRETEQALLVWAEYQSKHDVSSLQGQAVGIDPASGRVWFGDTALEIKAHQRSEGEAAPLYLLRVGSDHYGRKGGRR